LFAVKGLGEEAAGQLRTCGDNSVRRSPPTQQFSRLPTLHVINGRFGAQRVTGVQRVAHGLLSALDAIDGLPGRWRLLSPAGVAWPPLRRIEFMSSAWPPGAGHGWEQIAVAIAATRGARVLNIAGSGPWLGGAQVSWLHDAAVFDHPEAYRPAFVAWYRELFRQRARRGDLLITPSENARARLAHHLGLPMSRLAVLAHGSDHLDEVQPDSTCLREHGLTPGSYWLSVASANPTKNLGRLLEAQRRVPAAERRPLVLVGGRHARVFAPDGGNPAPVGIVRVDRPLDACLKALLLGARALWLVSTYEGFGLPAAEAMRCGCAVVASRAGALPETCGDAARYVDPLDVDDIASAMVSLGRDDAEIARLRQAGLRRMQGFTWARSAERLLGMLQEWPA